VRSFLLTQAEAGTGLRGSAEPLARWTGRASVALPDELSADEARLTALVRSSGPFSLADRTLPAELGWAYGKVHRVANELVRRGVLTRTEAPGEIGRPRVVYSLTVA
jgi:predicted ArsR family transcriptional regulator